MRPPLLCLSFLLLLGSLLFDAQPAVAEPSKSDTASGRVVRIVDGDTFQVLLDSNRTEIIRLHGIDCPERSQPFSHIAKEKLSSLIFSKAIHFIRMDTDRYGRTIAMVFVAGLNVNEALLTAGLAWHFKRYDQNPEWAELERNAATRRVGLWADPHPVAPWAWRKK